MKPVQKLTEKVKEMYSSTESKENKSESEEYNEEIISRRQFGKLLGLGSAGAGGALMFGGNAAATTIDPGFVSLNDDDDVQFGNDNDFEIRYDSANNQWELVDDGQGVIYKVDAGTNIVDFMNDINFPNITGTPTFGGHDHTSGGLNTIPNSGLTNSSLTVGSTSISLGGSGTPEADNLAGNNGTNGQVLQTDGSSASWSTISSGASVSDDGTEVLSSPDDVNYVSGLNVTDDSDGTVSVDLEEPHDRVAAFMMGAEGATTTSTSYVTIKDSDVVLNFDNWTDSNSNVYIKFRIHLSNNDTFAQDTSGDSLGSYARLYRQNAGTAVSGSEVFYEVEEENDWGIVESSWIDISGDSGDESYHIQLKTDDATEAEVFQNSPMIIVATNNSA